MRQNDSKGINERKRTDLNGAHSKHKEYHECQPIPPLWHLRIVPHQPRMHVILLDPVPLDPFPDRPSIEQRGVHERCRRQRHGDHIHHRERGRQVDGRVGCVRDGVEGLGRRREDARVVVRSAEAVEGGRGEDGEVAEVPDLCGKEEGWSVGSGEGDMNGIGLTLV